MTNIYLLFWYLMGVGKHSYAYVHVSTVTENVFFFMLTILNKLYVDSLLALVFVC